MSRPDTLTASAESRVRTSFAAQAMLATMGASIVEVGAGRVVLEMPSDPRFGQQFGYTHAGAVTALVDTACGYAALTTMADDREVLTVDFSRTSWRPRRGSGSARRPQFCGRAGRSSSRAARCTR